MLYQSLKSNFVVVHCGKILIKWGAENGNKFTRTKQGSCTSKYCLTSQTPLKKHHASNLKKNLLGIYSKLKKDGGKLQLGEMYPDSETKSCQQTVTSNS